MTVPDVGAIRRYVDARMRTFRLPGVAVTAVRDGRTILSEGFGFADLEHRARVSADSPFLIGSVTKQFTAALVLLQAEAGRIGIDDPVGRHLPDLPEPWRKATLRHLLTHTSGIPNFTETTAIEELELRHVSQREVVESIAGRPMPFAPGERWSYCDANFFLLGMVLERVAKTPYGQLLRERILAPLGMRNTRLSDTSSLVPGRVRGYVWKDGAIRNARFNSLTWAWSAGAIASSSADLAIWDRALTSDRLLSRRSRAAMTSPVRLNDGTTVPYGFGLALTPSASGARCVWHSGSIAGFTSCVCRFPDQRTSVIVLSNRDAFWDPFEIYPSRFMAFTIAGLCDPALAVRVPRPPSAPPSSTVRRFVAGLAAGTLDRALCTPGYLEAAAFDLNAFRTFFPMLGRPVSLHLLKRSAPAPDPLHPPAPPADQIEERCLIRFREGGWIFRFRTAPDGRIAGVTPEAEVL